MPKEGDWDPNQIRRDVMRGIRARSGTEKQSTALKTLMDYASEGNQSGTRFLRQDAKSLDTYTPEIEQGMKEGQKEMLAKQREDVQRRLDLMTGLFSSLSEEEKGKFKKYTEERSINLRAYLENSTGENTSERKEVLENIEFLRKLFKLDE